MKKMMKYAVLLGLVLLGLAAGLTMPIGANMPLGAKVVRAQDAGGGGGDATTYDFEDDIVSGDLVRPDGEMLNVRRRGQRASLIRIREHFIPEMLKSVEDL